jgi:integrase
MVSYRRLPATRQNPAGRWQASVVLPIKLPNGKSKRATKTHALKGVLRTWATEMEARIATGDWSDPRGAEITLDQWRVIWLASRYAATATMAKDESHWRNHVEPRWAGYPLSEITRARLLTWVREMIDAGLGAWTIAGAFGHVSGMLAAAVEDKRLPANPAAGIKLPRADPKPVFYWTRDEASALLLGLGGADALLVDLGLHTGLRIGELLGLRRAYVDTAAGLIHVVGVQTRRGWREYPKSKASRRPVPVPAHLRDQLWAHIALLGPDGYVFSPGAGKPWDDRNYANRVFDPAVAAAGIRHGTQHDMRHTAASWLVQGGMDLYKLQALLGHENHKTTQKYAHLKPDAFDDAQAIWAALPVDARRAALDAVTVEGREHVRTDHLDVPEPGGEHR